MSLFGRAVVMLYYRDPFNYHVNVGVVRRLRARLPGTELGIKVAQMIFGETEKDLRRGFHAPRGRKFTRTFTPKPWWAERNTAIISRGFTAVGAACGATLVSFQ